MALSEIPEQLRPYIGHGVLTLLMAIMTWLGRRSVKKIDEHGFRLSALEQTFISRDEFQKYMAEMRADRQSMHTANLQAIAQLRTSVDGVNTNIINTLALQLKK